MSLYRNGFYEIDFTIGRESIEFAVGERVYRPQNSYLFFISPFLLQSYHFFEAAPGTRSYMLYFKPEFLNLNALALPFKNFPFLEATPQPIYPLSETHTSLFEELFERMIYEYQTHANGSLDIIRSYLQIVLHQTNRC